MKATLPAVICVFAVGFAARALAVEANPEDVRQKFAGSGIEKLELAAEALGDRSLLNLLENLRQEALKDPKLRKIIHSFE